jgi:hypothetical protein
MVVPDFVGFGQVVTKRIVPTFDTFGAEALKHGEEWFRSKSAGLFPSDNDQHEVVAHFADKAIDETLAFADTLAAMYFASVGLYSVGLFHLFEQHFADLRLQILEAHTYSKEIDRKEVEDWLKADASIDVTAFTTWPVIEELRLVANTIKHAEGNSAKDLRVRRPDLFIHPSKREGGACQGTPFQSRVRKPLFGEDLYLTTDDFSRYVEGVIAFWTDLADAMANQP